MRSKLIPFQEIDVPEETIIFLQWNTGVDPSSVVTYVSLDPLRYSFYQLPGTDAVAFIHTKFYSP